jgi:signal-transduction protein with cAMP-binding, CBS, and nucleotidyltransferase domain
MVQDVVTIDPSASVVEAANRMRETNVGMLPIVENGRLRAVLTDRDLVVRAIARQADLTGTRAVECATEQPITAKPDWDIDDALEAMAREQVGRLPVVDDQGRLVGVVTLGSIVLRGDQDKRALETAREVSRRAAKRPQARAAQRTEDRAATRQTAKPAQRVATKGRPKTGRRLKRAS